MENQVSLPALPWQRALTTPPLVVLLLYLQNAQLSFKTVSLSAGARQAGRGGARREDKGWEGESRGGGGGGDWELVWMDGGGEQLRARRFLCIL